MVVWIRTLVMMKMSGQIWVCTRLPIPYLPDGVEITAPCGVRPKSSPTNNPPHTCFSPSIFPFAVNDNLVFQQSLIASPRASRVHTQIWPLIFIITNVLIQTTISFLLGSDNGILAFFASDLAP